MSRDFAHRYDGDTQQMLELMISEKNHRKLHSEHKGDYSAIAKRLEVANDRLVGSAGIVQDSASRFRVWR